jgi:hypothetical protein
MGGGEYATLSPFRLELERWKAVAGGIDRNGNVLAPPWELQKARLIDGLCQRYSCLPSQLLKEDMDTIFLTQTVLHAAGDMEGQQDEKKTTNPKMNQLANISKRL